HYRALGGLVGNTCIMPDDTDVANALGAVVGQVRVTCQAQVSQPQEGLFRVSDAGGVSDHRSEAVALDAAERAVRAAITAIAAEAGAADAEVTVERDIRTATVEDRRTFIEA